MEKSEIKSGMVIKGRIWQEPVEVTDVKYYDDYIKIGG